MKYVKWAAKAVIAGATAFGATFALAWTGDHAVDAGEIAIIAVGTITAAAGVFLTPNGPNPNSTPEEEPDV